MTGIYGTAAPKCARRVRRLPCGGPRRCRAVLSSLKPSQPCTSPINGPDHSFTGGLCTNIKVSFDRDAVVLPSPQRCVCVRACVRLLCGDLLHSKSVATADLLKRVHAPWPVHRPRNAIRPRRMWEVVQPNTAQPNGTAQLQATNGGKDGLPVLEPYLGSLLTVSGPKRRRVWLRKIHYVRGLRGRHGAESHSERNIHKAKAETGERRRGEKAAGRGVVCGSVAVLFSSFRLSPQHLARSLRIRDATPP